MRDCMEGMDKKLKLRVTAESAIIRLAVDYFHDSGFVQLLPVVLGKSTDPLGPDPGSSIVKTPEIEYGGERLYTMNSMILHKQVAVKDLEKIFILSPNIRLERPERGGTKRHLFEFTQLDFEIKDAKMDDVIKVVEGFLAKLGAAIKADPRAASVFSELGVEPFEFRPPFKRYTTHELEAKYGQDWESKASMSHDQPFWALCHKREFYEREDDSEPGHYLNYDLIYPKGYGEALSGGEREYEYGRIMKRMSRDKLELGIYDAYIEQLKKGFAPSAGAGFGIERLARFMTAADHVGDVQVFRRVPGEKVVV